MAYDLVDPRGQRVGSARSRASGHRAARTKKHAGSHLHLVNNRARPGFVQMGGRDVFPRDFYLPKEVKGTTPIRIEDLEVYYYASGSARPGAIVFAGKAQKPLWHHTFFSAEARDRKVAETIASRRRLRKYKEEKVAAKKAFKHDVKVGDIFDTNWGYDQTNVEFFEVIEVRGADVIVREIAQQSVAGPKQPYMTDKVVGVPGNFIGKPIRVRPQHGGGMKIEGHYASKWNGSPQYTSSYA
jgi:hypothetical protein